MGSRVPTTHLSSLLFSTHTTRRKHYSLSQLAATATQTRARTRRNKKCVLKQKMSGRPWGKMTTMQGGVKKAATLIRFAFRGNQSNHTVVSARRTWRNVFAKSL